MEQVVFETPEDVALSFELAGPASRLAAALVDYTIIGLVTLAGVAALSAAGVLAVRWSELLDPGQMAQIGGLAAATLVVILFAVHTFYFVTLEWMMGGQTIGKRWLELRVVGDGGRALTFAAAFVRNLARLVDGLPGLYLVGLGAIMLSADRRRLGDYMAGTLVVRHSKVAPPQERFAGQRYSNKPDRRFEIRKSELATLGPSALALLDRYFERAPQLPPPRAQALARTLADQLSQKMARVAPETGSEVTFLEEVFLALREHLGA